MLKIKCNVYIHTYEGWSSVKNRLYIIIVVVIIIIIIVIIINRIEIISIKEMVRKMKITMPVIWLDKGE